MARRPTSKSSQIRKSPSRRSKPSPYPARGTPLGDLSEGTCDGAGCGIELYRGDIFAVTANKQVFCRECWAVAPGIDKETHRAVVKAFEAVAPRQHPPAQPTILRPTCVVDNGPKIYDGAFPE